MGGTHAASYPTVTSSTRAGYMASDRWFRFVGTTVKVPSVGAYDHYARVVLRGQNTPSVILALKPGGGADSVGWGVGAAPFGMGGGALAIAPAVGDTVRIELYSDRVGGGGTASATDLTTNAKAAGTISEGTKAIFTKAEVGTVLETAASPPASDLQLWQYTDPAVTNNTGVHGTTTGPWTTSMVLDSSHGQLVMSPSSLFNKGAGFGVWLRD